MPDAESGGALPPGQWVHAQLFEISLPTGSRLSLGEGGTPLEPAAELGADLGIPKLQLKREDLNPTGSHKARCLSLLCSDLAASGRRQAVISSSGNAAVAAAAYASLGGIRVLSLVSPKTPRVKLERLRSYPQLTVLSNRPVALLHHAVASWGLSDLRGSVNPLAPNAYRGIAAELMGAKPLAAVFLFSSSGASALGLAQGFDRLLAPAQDRPQLHLVEGSPGGEMTRPWYPGSRPEAGSWSPLGELRSRRSRLAPAVRRAVRATGGRGWRVEDAELAEVRQLAERRGLRTSWEGLATLAAMRQAAAGADLSREGSWVAVLTGDQAQLDLEPWRADDPLLPTANSEAELDRLLQAAAFTRPTGR
ncbi:MAG TPA: PLP-dependent lyase/thiolase [Candidatus Dormibacteraeota bacterium]|nr:PLP-dependent lyase/thiolase [Candidatus Dormibacteraeota bacterium]